MQCPNCRAAVSPGAAVCPVCGSSLDAEPTLTYVPVDPEGPALSPEEAASVSGFAGYALVVERGPRAGQTWVLPGGIVTAGRSPESDIFLDDVTVSRAHCRFLVDEDELVVEDAGSTNGTYVNGDRVDRATLKPGDEVLVGRFHLQVALGNR